jgi:Mor family transcriptional regulator
MPVDWLADIAAEIPIESLPREYQVVAELIGMENALKLAQHIGGGRIYYPKIETLLRDKRDERIRAEFTGCNHRDLARKYALTETWIREIVQRKPPDETANLFEDVV